MSPSSNNANDAYMRFYKLYHDYYEKMLRYAAAVFHTRGVPDTGDGRAEEAVQEAFVYAWSNQEKMYESPSPENWLFKVLYYKVLERIKAEGKWSRNLRSFEQLVSVSNDADPYDRIENSLIEIISDEDYQLLKKLYIEGATYREICEEYHLTKSALGCKLHRIKQKLREKLINCFDE